MIAVWSAQWHSERSIRDDKIPDRTYQVSRLCQYWHSKSSQSSQLNPPAFQAAAYRARTPVYLHGQQNGQLSEKVFREAARPMTNPIVPMASRFVVDYTYTVRTPSAGTLGCNALVISASRASGVWEGDWHGGSGRLGSDEYIHLKLIGIVPRLISRSWWFVAAEDRR